MRSLGSQFPASRDVWPNLFAAAFWIMVPSLFFTPAGFGVKLSRKEWRLVGLRFGVSLLRS
jgi:hypothetical protein